MYTKEEFIMQVKEYIIDTFVSAVKFVNLFMCVILIVMIINVIKGTPHDFDMAIPAVLILTGVAMIWAIKEAYDPIYVLLYHKLNDEEYSIENIDMYYYGLREFKQANGWKYGF